MAKAALKADQTAYDAVPYESYAYPQTHPSHLHMIATLFGLTPPDFKTARVLEIGSAAGGNLFPIAQAYPKATFVGFDLSKEQIDQGQKHVEAMGLKNVTLLHDNILTFKSKQKFDYIICHGIFSWVPENVRAGIFKLCNEQLSENGVAIISYNALPGWNAVRSLREMMIYHTNRFTTPAEKVTQARALLDFLAENAGGNAGYKELIENERKMLSKTNNSYVFHDHMENENSQFYLHDFVAQARQQGLEYVGDASPASMYVGNMPKAASEKLKSLSDAVAQEQYMDFITNRRFRSTILCRADKKVIRNLRKEQVLDYCLTANPAMKVEGGAPAKETVFSVGGAKFKTQTDTATVLYKELVEAGKKAIPAAELLKRAQAKLGHANDTALRNELVSNGLQLFLLGFISLHSDSLSFETNISEKPVASPLARHQATANLNASLITNILSAQVPSGIVANIILQNLDGTKTAEQVATILDEKIKSGVLKIQTSGQNLEDPAAINKATRQVVSETLKKLADNALLVG